MAFTRPISAILRRALPARRRSDLKAWLRRHAWLRRAASGDLETLGAIHGTDKGSGHDYLRHYQDHFAPFRNRPINLLEIGVGGYDDPRGGGQSLRMWKDFFPRAQIFAIDLYDKSALQEPRIRIFQGSQADPEFLKRVAAEIGRIDLIIDDGSHVSEHIIVSFQTLFPLLAPTGLYAMEDLQTSYWPDHGGSHDPECPTTSIAMCKRLIDGLHWREIPGRHPSYSDEHVVAMHCYRELIILEKGRNELPMPSDSGGESVSERELVSNRTASS